MFESVIVREKIQDCVLRSWLCIVALSVLIAAPLRAQPVPIIPSEADVPVAMLVDISSGQVLYAREPDRRFVPASITKVMTLFHAFELMEEGYLDPRQQFTMRDETWREWHRKGSTMWIAANQAVLVDDLLMGIANVSANDGSIALAEGQAGSLDAWLDGMNGRARELGMADSHFGTPNGWPDEGRTFTTARDLVTLAEALIARHPQKYARYVGNPGFRFNDIEGVNRDPLIGETQGADGIKTGYTNEAGLGYVGSVKRNGKRLVVVVAGAQRNSTRREAATELIEWGFSAFEQVRIASEGQSVGYARVQGGSARSVALKTTRPVFVNVPKDMMPELRVFVSYDGPIRAPIETGAQVATLVVDVPGLEPARIPLVTEEPVETAGFFARMWNGFAGWFS